MHLLLNYPRSCVPRKSSCALTLSDSSAPKGWRMRGAYQPTRNAIETVWRIEAARLIGGLVRFVRSVDRAEDLAQEALLSAMERWPETGSRTIPALG